MSGSFLLNRVQIALQLADDGDYGMAAGLLHRYVGACSPNTIEENRAGATRAAIEKGAPGLLAKLFGVVDNARGMAPGALVLSEVNDTPHKTLIDFLRTTADGNEWDGDELVCIGNGWRVRVQNARRA